MNKLSDIAALGPVFAAQQLHRDGQGFESNPYPYETKNHDEFYEEMRRLQNEEFVSLMMECHG